MSFRYVVEKAGYLKSARVHWLDGRLEAGELHNGVTATADTPAGARLVRIKSVAFADGQRDPRARMVQIEPPDFPIEELVGAVLRPAG